MRLVWRTCLGLTCAALFGGAQAAPPPAEVFFKDPEITEALLSPSGTRLAITTSLGASRIGLAMMDLRPGGKVSRVVQFRDGDVRGV